MKGGKNRFHKCFNHKTIHKHSKSLYFNLKDIRLIDHKGNKFKLHHNIFLYIKNICRTNAIEQVIKIRNIQNNYRNLSKG